MCALALPAAAQPKKCGGPHQPACKTTESKPEPSGDPGAADKSDAKTAEAKPAAATSKKAPKEKTFDFNALDLNGRNRTPQLLYFLERANEELERASLEKRSFIPHMVRSVDEEAL
jgi:hypothetical protein